MLLALLFLPPLQVSSLPSLLSYLRSLKAVDAQSVAEGGLCFESPARASSCLRSRTTHRLVFFDVAAAIDFNGASEPSRRQPAGDAVADGLDVIGGHQEGLSLSLSVALLRWWAWRPCPLEGAGEKKKQKRCEF